MQDQKFINVAYGADGKEKWFGGAKPALMQKNSLMNLPYVVDGETVVTQSNSCLLYLGKKLGLDTEANFDRNHQALDQVMDLRNELMKHVYPFSGVVSSKKELEEKFPAHMEGSVKNHLKKLNDFCVGPYISGDSPESADFHLFEMLDQHMTMCCEMGIAAFDFKQFPKLMTLYKAFRTYPGRWRCLWAWMSRLGSWLSARLEGSVCGAHGRTGRPRLPAPRHGVPAKVMFDEGARLFRGSKPRGCASFLDARQTFVSLRWLRK